MSFSIDFDKIETLSFLLFYVNMILDVDVSTVLH